MKSTFALSVLFSSALLAGCSAAPESEMGSSEEAWTVKTSVSSRVVAASAGTLVASTTGSASTSNATVTATPPRVYVYPGEVEGFCGTTAGEGGKWVGRRFTTPSVLAKSCVLEWIGSNKPDPRALPRTMQSDDAKRLYGDAPIAAPVGTLMAKNAKPLNEAFRVMVSEGGPEQSNKSAAFVAVVDSAQAETASDEASTGTYEHGEIVGRIVREIGGASNALAVLSTTALPRDTSGATDPNGGYYGYTSDVARGILDAVDAWLRRTANEKPRRPLVVNLSLGWEASNYTGSALGGANPLSAYAAASVANYPQRSVFYAIQYANCAGALVLSAAGNVSEGAPATNTLMLPAAWESVPAPTRAQCDALGINLASTPRAASPRMTYAIGGIDGADRPLFNTRSAGQPRIVAYGDAVSVSRAAGGFTGAMTGTSMATAVASGIAAHGWSLRPTTNAHDVAAALYGSGIGLADPATACSYDGACRIRRASRCELASKLTASAPTSCTTVPAYGGTKVRTQVDPTALAIAFSAPAIVSPAAPTPAGVANAMVNPSVRPMPGSGGCSLCGIYSNTTYLEIANPSSSIGATVQWYSGGSLWGMSFTPSYSYMSVPTAGATSGTVTFTDPSSGWTSTQQLVLF